MMFPSDDSSNVRGWLVVKIDASTAQQLKFCLIILMGPILSHPVGERGSGPSNKAKVSDPPASSDRVAPIICDSIMNQDDDDVKANCQMSLIHCY